jgi:hypothetical protein
MKKIEYEYMTFTLGQHVSFGQIKREKNATTHQMVSEVTYPPDSAVPLTEVNFRRTETRGDGRTRVFQYTMDGMAELVSYTDFKNQPTQITSPVTATPWLTYRKSVTDARTKTSSADMEWNAGAVLTITHPGGSTVHFTYTDPLKPYYLASREDELHHITHYDRIALGQPNENRIWQVRYPDDGIEQFTYDEYHFGLVTEHLMTNGATEHFRYDSRGLKRLYWPPPTESDPDPGAHPTVYAYYEAQDGIPRGSIASSR